MNPPLPASSPPSTRSHFTLRDPIAEKSFSVTGALRGLRHETALQYARAGASIAIVARTAHALDETKDLIIAAVPGADVLVLAADVRDVESVRCAVESVIQRF